MNNKEFEIELAKLLEPIQQPLKLILHVGTPKTGTTSLQVYLDKKYSMLKKKGILYPKRTHNSDAPTHQWFEKNLVRTHPQNLLDNFKGILSEVDENTHTILLSSEGIYNRWWDFPTESKALLTVLNELSDVNIWVWFKEPLIFAEDFYKQCMRNPLVKDIPCYGKDLSFAEVLKDPWFKQRLDYMGFVNECDQIFGKSSISIFECNTDTVQTVRELLGIATPHDSPAPRKNKSLNAITTELYRIINRLELSAKEKEKIVPHMHEINTALTSYAARSNESLIDKESRDEIIKMTSAGMRKLQTRFE